MLNKNINRVKMINYDVSRARPDGLPSNARPTKHLNSFDSTHMQDKLYPKIVFIFIYPMTFLVFDHVTARLAHVHIGYRTYLIS
jgi:hypothetical protein